MPLWLTVYTLVHVAISLVGIGAGFIVWWGMLNSKRLDGWTALFLATTVLTSATGFGFPFEKLLPSHVIGILSLLVLAAAIYARYPGRMAGPWKRTYVITALISQYFNVFVLVAQAFKQIPLLKSLAPTQSEPPFAIAQLVVLVAFLVFGYWAVARFNPPA